MSKDIISADAISADAISSDVQKEVLFPIKASGYLVTLRIYHQES